MVELVWREFDALSRDELYALLMLRADVFVLEQRSFFRDIDGEDGKALHLLLTDDAGRLLGTLRLAEVGDGSLSMGRVALRPEARGKGQGGRMMRAALDKAEGNWGRVPVVLAAQTAQEAFYRSFGFRPVSKPYDDAGILHTVMRRDP